VFHRLAGAILLVLALSASTISAQPTRSKDYSPEALWLEGIAQRVPGVQPYYTAFPELLTLPRVFMGKNPDGTPYHEHVSDADFLPPLPPLAADAPPLRKVRHEQVREGLASLALLNEVPSFWMRQLTYSAGPWFFRQYVNMTSEVYRAAAEFEEVPARRVRWCEARLRKLKEIEWWVFIRALNGEEMPPHVNYTRFVRLRAEAELLALLADVERTGAMPVPFPMPPPDPPLAVLPDTLARDREHITPTYTAFPDLKLGIIATKAGSTPEGTTWSYRFGDDPVALPILPILPVDASLLHRVKHEQVLEGLAYLHRLDEAIRTGGWKAWFTEEYLEASRNVFRLASVLETHPRDRIRWYEACLRKLKELELVTETGVRNGTTSLQTLTTVRFWRLHTEAELLVLLAAVKNTDSESRPAAKRAVFEFKEVRPFFTAFPDLKPPTVVIRTEKGDPSFPPYTIAEVKDAIPLPTPVLATNAPTLRKVQFEQVQTGLHYLIPINPLLGTNRWWSDPYFREYLDIAMETYRLGAKLETTTAGRVPWYEARIRWLKRLEASIETSVSEGQNPPQQLNLARIARLQAEAELLELQAEVTAPAIAPAPPYSPQPVCPHPRGGLLPKLFPRR
jgi:hypothetical protein